MGVIFGGNRLRSPEEVIRKARFSMEMTIQGTEAAAVSVLFLDVFYIAFILQK